MASTDRPKTRLTDVVRVPLEVRQAHEAGYSARAWALQTKNDMPENPYPHPTTAGDREGVAMFGAWAEGAAQAETIYLKGWHTGSHKGEWHHAVEAYGRTVLTRPVEDLSELEDPKPVAAAQGKPAPVTAAIHGYVQQTDGRQALVDRAKLLEAQVLAYIDELKGGISQEMADMAADMAAYQNDGYQRLSVEAQTAKLDEFKARDSELNTALRWLSAGRTSIEVGFMEVNRSTFRPKPVKAPQ